MLKIGKHNQITLLIYFVDKPFIYLQNMVCKLCRFILKLLHLYNYFNKATMIRKRIMYSPTLGEAYFFFKKSIEFYT